MNQDAQANGKECSASSLAALICADETFGLS